MNYENIAFQSKLSYLIPEISNHKEYFEYHFLLERIDEILKLTALDLEFAAEYLRKISRQRKANG